MVKFVMMCGIPGAGKSSFAEHLSYDKEYVVHSSDKIREELGDINDQSRNEEVFKILHNRIKSDLKDGKNVVYDACQVKRKDRVAFLSEIKNIKCQKICVVIATPFEYCLAQNFARERHIPEDVLIRFYKNFQMPCTYEGFDEVIVHYNDEAWSTWYGSIGQYVKSLCGFNQNNHHHELSLGDHMISAGKYVCGKGYSALEDITLAAFSHDIGKVKTKAYKNGKGEATEEAHYFSHHNVGAYDSLFYNYGTGADKKYIALLIELHMRPYLEWKQSERVKKKDFNMFGEDVINDVMLLHEADVNAH